LPEIEFRNVTKRFGEVVAVKNLTFTIYDGEYLSLLGPSGCGKTTTLRMIAGLINPTEGEILWNGRPIHHLHPSQRNIGYVFQNFAIFPHLTVWENVAYGPEVKGFPEKEVEDLVETYLKLVGMKGKEDEYAVSLSAPDKQRVGIARVLASGAKTLLLDEPMGALDQQIREKFQDELRGIVKKLGLTAVHVTHDQSEAMAISDRIGVMKKGEILQVDSPLNLLFNPETIFVNNFIGEANFFEGIVTSEQEGYLKIELYSGEIFTVTKPTHGFLPGDRVVIGIRKEFPIIYPSDGLSRENYFSGIVEEDRFVGEKRRVIIRLKYDQLIEIKNRNTQQSFKHGDKVDIEVPSLAINVFPYPKEGLAEAVSVT